MGAIQARKSLGQNFLADPNIIRKIVAAINSQPGENIIEIGPGQGALTRALLETGAKLNAVEKDPRMVPVLDELSEKFPDFSYILDDALQVDFSSLASSPCKLVGNLPYNVGTQIIFKALETPHAFTGMTFMLQKEVVARITAKPGSKDWGRLGVWCQWLCDCRKLFDVPATAFRPPPKVTSSIVCLSPLAAPRYPADPIKLNQLVKNAFTQRRKMLRSSLKNTLTEDAYTATDIAPTARPEELTLEQFCQLSNYHKG